MSALDYYNGPVPVGTIIMAGFPMFSGGGSSNLAGRWLVCNGQAVSRTTYVTLFNSITRQSTVTGVDTVNDKLNGSFSGSTGDSVYLTTTGTLPSPLSPNVIYYLIISGSDVKLALTRANARAGTAIDLTSSPSGTHKVVECPWGLGDGSTTFNVPNLAGKVIVGQDVSDTNFDLISLTGGEATHTLTSTEMPSHTHTQDSHNHTQDAHGHTISVRVNATGFGTSGLTRGTATGTVNSISTDTTVATNQATTATNQNTGGGGAHNNLQPYATLTYLIKY